jgi:hypothetical protein
LIACDAALIAAHPSGLLTFALARRLLMTELAWRRWVGHIVALDSASSPGKPNLPPRAGRATRVCRGDGGELHRSCKHLAATFYLLAESFDDDPFRILAWRGRPREDLLDHLHAVRADRSPAADSTEYRGVPLEECLQSYFAVQGDLPRLSPQVTSGSSLLDQLPPMDVTLRGSPLTELLRPLVFRSFC